MWHSVLAQTTPPRAGGRVKNFHENERLPSTLPAKMAAEGERDHKFVNKQKKLFNAKQENFCLGKIPRNFFPTNLG